MAKRTCDTPLHQPPEKLSRDNTQDPMQSTLHLLLSNNLQGINMNEFLDLFCPHYICYFGMYMYKEDLCKYRLTSKHPMLLNTGAALFNQYLTILTETLMKRINSCNIIDLNIGKFFEKMLVVIREPIYIHTLVFFGFILRITPMTSIPGRRFQEEAIKFCLNLNDRACQDVIKKLIHQNQHKMPYLVTHVRPPPTLYTDPNIVLQKYNLNKHPINERCCVNPTGVATSTVSYEESFKSFVNSMNKSKTRKETNNNYMLPSSTTISRVQSEFIRTDLQPPSASFIDSKLEFNFLNENNNVTIQKVNYMNLPQNSTSSAIIPPSKEEPAINIEEDKYSGQFKIQTKK